MKMNCRCIHCSYRDMVFNVDNETILHRLVLCKEVNLGLIREWLKTENPNAQDSHNDTPLHLAALNEANYEIVTELINAGAEVQIKNWVENTPLHVAVLHSNRRITEVLLQSGANVNSRNMLGDTPLHSIIKPSLHWQVEDRFKDHGKLIVKMLIQAGADVNSRNNSNETPLFLAIEMGDFDIVQELLKSGANPNICNYDSTTCLHVALQKLHLDYKLIVDLVKNGANIDCKDRCFITPLDLAVIKHVVDPSDELKTAKLLIKVAILVHPEKSNYLEYISIVSGEVIVQDLYEFQNLCSTVVSQMKELRITKDFTLYDFVLRIINYKLIKYDKAYSKVLFALIKGNFDVYREILDYFPKLYFKEILTNVGIFANNEIDDREIKLIEDVVWLICDYLNRTDIIQLIKASPIAENNFLITD